MSDNITIIKKGLGDREKSMNSILEYIKSIGIVPVIQIDNAEDAIPLAEALCEGGLPCAEVTFRTEAAKEAISKMTKAYPNILVGAGTVLTIEQVNDAIEAGAKFVISPGLNPKIVKYCVDNDILIIPGCSNPSDVEQAIELGLEVVKFFPAEASGGINMIKAMSAPYTKMKFMPTGGINEKNLNDYLKFNKIVACGGSWMANPELLKRKDFDEIKRLTKEAVKNMLGFELLHVGINTNSNKEANDTAKAFEDLFNFETQDKLNSVFAGSHIEVMKEQFLGNKGHLAIGTNSINRAISYLKNIGYEFDENNKYYDDKGNLISIYLKEQVGGFAIHLLQK